MKAKKMRMKKTGCLDGIYEHCSKVQAMAGLLELCRGVMMAELEPQTIAKAGQMIGDEIREIERLFKEMEVQS